MSIRGIVEIEIEGKPYRLRYTWAALEKLHARFGDDIMETLSAQFQSFDGDKTSEIVAIGLEAEHPGITKELVMEASPPIAPTLSAVLKAVSVAISGPVGTKDAKKNEKMAKTKN